MLNDLANRYMDNKKIHVKYGGIVNYRRQMVLYALKHNISKAAREFKATRKTVRKWVTAFLTTQESDKHKSLMNKSRLGQNHPCKVSDEVVQEIIKYRKATG